MTLFFLAFYLSVTQGAQAQKIVPGTFLEQIDKLTDSTTLGFYPSVENSSASFEILDLTARLSFNSAYPRGFNDGAVWKGKGVNAELHGGISGKKGRFSYQLMPVLFFSQNSDFSLVPNADSSFLFNYQFNRIDWVQRYGNGSEVFFHPGQSEVKYQNRKFVASISTQNYSYGPGTFNPILLSHQGPGIPHLRIGSEPFSIGKKVGQLEVNFLLGFLRESAYFDDSSGNDWRYLNGLFFGYKPSFLPNLKIGFGRVLYKQTRFFETEDLLSTLIILEEIDREGFNSGNDTWDQLASAFIDWRFPEVGFRAYAEFAKNDFTGQVRGTIVEPEHTRGYTIGFQKELKTKTGKAVSVIYEHINLSRNHAHLWRATPSFYTHGINLQGYTNNGQLVGAGIGSGGNSDHLWIKIDNKRDQQIAFLAQRIENNRDYFVVQIQDAGQHDIEYAFGTSFIKKLDRINLSGELSVSHNFNRYYIDKDATNIAILIGASIPLY
ncbi:MAG: hypothetical protein AAF616_14785 [Bacteroidota bacterium]